MSLYLKQTSWAIRSYEALTFFCSLVGIKTIRKINNKMLHFVPHFIIDLG